MSGESGRTVPWTSSSEGGPTVSADFVFPFIEMFKMDSETATTAALDVKPIYKAPVQQKSGCGGPGCSLEAGLRCSRCLMVSYCSINCQKAAWSSHKSRCKELAAGASVVPVPGSASSFRLNSTASTEDQKKAHILSVIAKVNALRPDEAGDGTCGQCPIPANSKTLCFECSTDLQDGGPRKTGRAMFICGKGHLNMTTDTSMGDEVECVCEESQSIPRPPARRLEGAGFSLPSIPRVLIVGGLARTDVAYFAARGMSIPQDPTGPIIEKIKTALTAKGLAHDSMLADDGEGVSKRLLTNRYSKIIFYGLTESGIIAKQNMFDSGTILSYLPQWVEAGGKFVLHGEGFGITVIANALLGEIGGRWHQCGDFYRRCRFSLNRSSPAVVPRATT